MRIIFISYESYFKDILEYHFKSLDFEVIHIKDPIEVINKIDELAFNVIIYYERDYPRHWKPLLKVLRERKQKREAIFILISDKEFSFEEAAKAIYLKTNGIITDNLYTNRVIFRIEEIIRRYIPQITDKRNSARYPVEESDRINFIFTHPDVYILISGRVLDISATGLRFQPKIPQRTEPLQKGYILKSCSLMLGRVIYTVDCSIVLNNQVLGLKFNYFKETKSHENKKIQAYLLDERMKRKLNYSMKNE